MCAVIRKAALRLMRESFIRVITMVNNTANNRFEDFGPLYNYQYRIIIIGDTTVGKSSLLRHFTEGRTAEKNEPTVGVDFYSRMVEIKPGFRIKLQLWDTAGQEKFR